jgi:hypothetical protein
MSIISLVLIAVTPQAQARFEMGTLRVGAALGVRGSSAGTTFAAAGTFGVFALKGVEVSVSNLFQTGGDSPTIYMLTGGVRLIPLPDLELTPYVAGEGGHLFVEGSDAWVAGVVGGLLYMIGPWYGLDVGVGYRWFFYPNEDPIGNWDVQVGLVFVF